MDLKKLIRDVPNFPIKGIIFKDITTLLKEPNGYSNALEKFWSLCFHLVSVIIDLIS